MPDLHARMTLYRRKLDKLTRKKGAGWRVDFGTAAAPWPIRFEMKEPGRFEACIPDNLERKAEVPRLPVGFERDEANDRALYDRLCTLAEAAELAEQYLSSFAREWEDFDPGYSVHSGYEECDVCGRPLPDLEGDGEVMFVGQALRLGVPIERVEELVVESLENEQEALEVVKRLRMQSEDEAEVRDSIRRYGPIVVRLCPVCISAAELLVEPEPKNKYEEEEEDDDWG